MSRRELIRMSDSESRSFLEAELVVTCATNGRSGWPHLMPLWFVLRGDEVWAWTYAKAQKVRNLERDPRATLQFEAGTEYQELRGVMLECDAEIVRDVADVQPLGVEIMTRYAPPGAPTDAVEQMVAAQAPKRV